ncbi:MAG: GHKL domain-containing protein, partial [FCB group bacterium]|nr:GHKL domain-containing protein [FCB group bacterium]
RVELEEKQAQLIHSGRLASLGELAAGVAHELNQPLQIIMAQAEVLKIMMRKSNALDNDVKEDLDTIIEEVSRASEIISHMRDFSRLDYKVSGEVDLTESIEKSLMFFRKQFKNHNIALTINYGDNLPGVELNPQRFEQVVVNFMSNARHAVNSRAGTEEASYQKEISINLYESRDQNALIFEVKDNGTGMTEEEKNHCTDPFYTTKEVSEGTGLGLSIVNGIVKEFNGHLEIESKLDIGTTMRVVIPLKLKR